MKNRSTLLIGLLLAVFAGTQVGHAYIRIILNGKKLYWSSWPVSWRMSNHAPEGFSDDSWKVAVDEAFTTWEESSQSNIQFNKQSATSSRNTGGNDHLVYFDQTNTSGYLYSGTVAVTMISYKTSSGKISDADIIFNDRDYDFSWSGENGKFDIQDVLTHEIGHFIGLDHSPIVGATMWPYVSSKQWLHRSLSQDDSAGATAVRSSGSPAALKGTIKKSDGSNLKGAYVSAIRVDDGRNAGSAMSNSSGTWTIHGLEPTDYYVCVAPIEGGMTESNLTGNSTVQTEFGADFYGGWPAPLFYAASAGNTNNIGSWTLPPDNPLMDYSSGTKNAEPGDTVTVGVSGSGFGSGLTATTLGGYLAVQSMSGGSSYKNIQVFLPSNTPYGLYDLYITTAGGELEIAPGVLEVVAPAPDITSLDMASGESEGGDTIHVLGSGFQDGALVMFGDTEAADVVFVDSTDLEVETPYHTVGSVDLWVHNPDGQYDNEPSAFTFSALPSLDAVFPSAGQKTGDTLVEFSGTNFSDGILVYFGSSLAEGVTVASETSMSAFSPPGAPGQVDITLVNPSAEPIVVPGAFAFVEAADPAISNIFPASGPSNGGELIQISGSNLDGTNTVRFGDDNTGSDATEIDPLNASTLSVVSPPQNGGEYQVRVLLDDGRGAISPQSYTVAGGASSGASNSGGGGGGCGGVIGIGRTPTRGLGDLPWFLLMFFWLKRPSLVAKR
ncbi:MAG: IPT/TIG domain-containing protein [Planctomycetota bacterium]|jgi:hypothetical protein|nr:IPT/TIG domain-containing protein [Planctomycetota bacterium]MDP6941642.1 IPT/TIG domain-containing protein [Planctomycetota bacterium]